MPARSSRLCIACYMRRNPPRRVSVGKLDERFGPLAKRVLPYRLFERMARGSLGV